MFPQHSLCYEILMCGGMPFLNSEPWAYPKSFIYASYIHCMALGIESWQWDQLLQLSAICEQIDGFDKRHSLFIACLIFTITYTQSLPIKTMKNQDIAALTSICVIQIVAS